jgi:hypothetical protein
MCTSSLFTAMFLLTRNSLARTIENPTKLHYILITQFDQLLSHLFTAATATAIHQNELILVGQFGDLVRADALVGHIDSAGNMPCGQLDGAAHVEDDISRLLRRHSCRLICGDLAAGVGLIIG